MVAPDADLKKEVEWAANREKSRARSLGVNLLDPDLNDPEIFTKCLTPSEFTNLKNYKMIAPGRAVSLSQTANVNRARLTRSSDPVI
jgi:hypothetical protein